MIDVAWFWSGLGIGLLVGGLAMWGWGLWMIIPRVGDREIVYHSGPKNVDEVATSHIAAHVNIHHRPCWQFDDCRYLNGHFGPCANAQGITLGQAPARGFEDARCEHVDKSSGLQCTVMCLGGRHAAINHIYETDPRGTFGTDLAPAWTNKQCANYFRDRNCVLEAGHDGAHDYAQRPKSCRAIYHGRECVLEAGHDGEHDNQLVLG